MAQQREASGGSLVDGEVAGRSFAFGQTISRIFHPIVLNICAFLIVGYHALPSRMAGLGWTAVCLLTQVLPPTVFYTIRARQGAFTDADVSVRHQRNELYAFALATVVLGTVLLLPFGLPRPFLALLLSAMAIGLICALVNLVWKISVHGASIASTATVALLYSRELGVVLWICALLVGWARIRTRNHTPLQVLAGFAVAALVVVLVFGMVA
ncbi:MAG TPA: phosphatase PAP2 family protein [Roseiflexaceae bacterium]|nr:phosphatase PAP2 family protein [Roseiflexaceae bacterium]